MAETPAHDQKLTVRLVEHIPPHGPRGAAFDRAKARMKKLGLTKCAIEGCDTGAPIEYHHSIVEHAWQGGVDVEKLNRAFGLHLADNEFVTWVQSPGNLEALCSVPQTPVLMASGEFVPISAVEVGDRVIGSDGRPHVVTATVSRPYDGDVIDFGDAAVTDDHLVLTSRGWIPAGACRDEWGGRMLCLEMGSVAFVQSEIFDPVVGSVPVDVMDAFGGQKRTPDVLLHDQPMFHDRFASGVDTDISTLGRLADFHSLAGSARQCVQCLEATRVRAELFVPSVSAAPDSKLNPANLADVLVPDDSLRPRPRVISHTGSVHDIEVAGCHSFVTAGGLVLHNCSVHHRTQLGIHAFPEPLWNLVRIWKAGLPPPAEHV